MLYEVVILQQTNKQMPFTARWLQHQQKQQHSSCKQTTTQSITATCYNRQKLKTVEIFLNPTQNERMNEWNKKCNYLLTYWLTNWQLWEIAELLIFREVLTALDISRKKQNCSNHQLEVLFPPGQCVCAFFLSYESHHTLHGCKSLGSFAITKPRQKATSKHCSAKGWRRVRVVEL